MTYENIKSLVLTLLVIISIFLTWNIWTFRPDYETMENTNYVQEVSIGEKREIKAIIKPERALFHYQNAHYATELTSELDKMTQEISTWNIFDVKNYTNKVEDFEGFVHGNGKVEILFPEKVPLDIYKNALNFENENIPNLMFDRIVIDMNDLQKETGTVYFVSYMDKKVYSSHVSSTSMNVFYRDFYKFSYKYTRYYPYEPRKNLILFLPEEKMVMMKYKYYPDYLDSEKFKEALFPDPSFVQKTYVDDGEEFTDGSSKMNNFFNEKLLFYVNPIGESDYLSSSSNTIQRGIDFINEHGGWTDPFRYAGIDDINQSITFRLYSSEGYPVFNETGMSKIVEVWGRNEIVRYQRPNFSLDLPLRTEMQEVEMPSGKNIVDYLEDQYDYNPELLQDLRLGYHMEKDPKDSRLIVLEPSWFYRYNGNWSRVQLLRGGRDGLE
jgi:regulatory protein YycH of two-component signal transduction system YycFG